MDLAVALVLLAPLAAGQATPEDAAAAFDAFVEEALARGRHPSLAVGVVRGDELAYARASGDAREAHGQDEAIPATVDIVYRIGSVTKVFTVVLLLDLVEDGVVRLDDPVALHVPDDVAPPSDRRGDGEITLRHLATHASGLRSAPENLSPRPGDPWNDYTLEGLWASVASARPLFPPGTEVSYSNQGMALLGQALAHAAGRPYEELLRVRILEPLDMMHTSFDVPPEPGAPAGAWGTMATGYPPSGAGEPVVPWRLGAMAPAGSLASTVGDLARFLSFQLRGGEEQAGPLTGGNVLRMQRPHRILPNWEQAVGLGWFIDRDRAMGTIVRHNGGMAGYRSHLSLVPDQGIGVVLLTNSGWAPGDNDLDALGRELLALAMRHWVSVDARLAAMAESLGEHIRAEPPDTLADLFLPGFLDRVPLSEIEKVFRTYHRERGRCLGVASVLPTDLPGGARIILSMERGPDVTCEIQLEGDGDPRLRYLRFD